jgi:glycosyltransferase involved in cell wall biosynthesis
MHSEIVMDEGRTMQSLPSMSTLGGVKKTSHAAAVSLDGVKILLMASVHAFTDPRIYPKQACSLQRLGATVTVVGKLAHDALCEVNVVPVPEPSSRLRRFLWQPWRCVWTARWQRADILHLHNPEMLITLPVARLWWWRSKFVFDMREDYANLLLIRDWLPAWLKPVVRSVSERGVKGLAAFAHAIVGVTPALTEKLHHTRSITAYNYVSREFFTQADQAKRQPRQREFDLVHLGTLNVKRAQFLADTLRAYHQLRPGARSLVIGVTAEIKEVMQGSIPQGCTLLGRTPYTEIPHLLGNARVGLDVHPWLGAHLAVALPVKVCEYMAAGCAVVSSAMPVLNQILAEAGDVDGRALTIIEGGNPIDYAKAVAHWVEAIDKGADPGSTLRELALKHMVWEAEAAKIAQLYLALLGKTCAT